MPAASHGGGGPMWPLLSLAFGVVVLWHVAVSGAAAVSGMGVPTVQESMDAMLRTPANPLAGYDRPMPSPWLVWPGFLSGMAVAVAASWWWIGRRYRRRRREGMGSRRKLAPYLGQKAVRMSAAQTRPRMTREDREKARIDEVAVPLGRAEGSGQRLYGQLEDSIFVVGGPRSMKTAAVIIDRVRASPGPTVAVSTKADVLMATYLARQRRGRVWVFDPGDVVGWPHEMNWATVAGAEDPAVATARAEGFAAAAPRSTETRNSEFFEGQARDVLRCFLHAAALDGATMEQVIKWSYHIDSPNLAAREILRTHPLAAPNWAEELEALTAGDAREGPLDSTRKTLQRLMAPFSSARLLRMCCPPRGTGFDARAFVESTDTLFVIVGDDQTVAPLVTTLVNEVMRAARRLSQRMVPPRLDPPLRVVIDEVAQCPLPNLPTLMSDAGGRGVTMLIGSQGLGQARARWGRDGAAELLASATTKVIMSGTSERDLLAEQSQLAGEVEVASESTTVSERGGVSSTAAPKERPRIRPHEIRELPPGSALMLYRQAPPVIVEFKPFWLSDWADEAERSAARVADIVAGRAQQ